MATKRADALKIGEIFSMAEEPFLIDAIETVELKAGESDEPLITHIHVEGHRENGDEVQTWLLPDNRVDIMVEIDE